MYLQAVTMIDPATCWIEIRSMQEVWAYLIANQVELSWSTRYQLSSKIIADSGKEFSEKFKQIILNDYGILCNSISSWNTQGNTIDKRVCLPDNRKCTSHLQIQELDLKDETLREKYFHLL